MPYTQRQVIIRAREAAALALRALDRDRMVSHFVDSYAVEYSRPSCTAYPAQYQELVAMLRREALLSMATWMQREIPRHLGRSLRASKSKSSAPRRTRKTGKKAAAKSARTKDAPLTRTQERFAVQFREEFLNTLADAHDWRVEEDSQFRHDLELYHRLSHFAGAVSAPRRLTGTVGGPFVDRCAVLLDTSMFESARRAAARFEERLRVAAESILKTVFSKRRDN
jgi:hypothetical protein